MDDPDLIEQAARVMYEAQYGPIEGHDAELHYQYGPRDYLEKMARALAAAGMLQHPAPPSDDLVGALVEFWHTHPQGKLLDDAARDWLAQNLRSCREDTP